MSPSAVPPMGTIGVGGSGDSLSEYNADEVLDRRSCG